MDRKFFLLLLLAVLAFLAIILGVGYATGTGSNDKTHVECIHIGDNPCVPVSK